MLIFNYTAGSFIDQVTKTVMTPTNVTHRQTEKGVASIVGANKYITQSISMLPEGDFTVVVWSKLKPSFVVGTDRASFISNTTTGLKTIMSSYNVIGGKPILSLSSSVYRVFNYIPDKNWHCYIFTFSNISTSTLKVDNVNISAFDTSIGTEDARSSFVYVGGGNNSSANIEIAKIKVYDTVLTTDEQTKEYKEFLQATPTEKEIRGFEYPKPTDLSYEVDSKVGDNVMGTLDFTSGWTAVNVSSSSAISFTTSTVGGYYKESILTTGNKYKVIIYGTSSVGWNLLSRPIGTTYITQPSGSFNITTEITAVNTGLYFYLSGAGTLTISEIIIVGLSGLQAAYSFSPETVSNGTLIDVSGNENNGIINGALLTKDGMKFDGVDDEVQIDGTSISSVIGAGDFTYSGRFYVNNLPSEEGYVFGTGMGQADTVGIAISSTGTIRSRPFAIASATTTNTVSAGRWYTFSHVINKSGNAVLYINGIPWLTQDVSAKESDTLSTDDWYVATERGTVSFADIQVEDLRIDSHALTQQEIVDYHNSFIIPYILEDFSNNAVGDTL